MDEVKQEVETVSEHNDVCDDCRFSHLTDEAIKSYLGFLIDYLDDFDEICGVPPDEEWRVTLGMERSGI